jgi:hypothetical protein
MHHISAYGGNFVVMEHEPRGARQRRPAVPRPAARPAVSTSPEVPAPTTEPYAAAEDTPLVQTLARAVQERATHSAPVLARMPGLPTKKEAETQGGKAGFHFGRGKTSYGRILEALSLFRATTDKGVAAQLLLQLQALVDEWHASGSRSMTNAADLRKREFLGKLKPKLKQLYFDVATKESIYDPIAQNAALHADTNRERMKQTLKKAGQGYGKKKIDALLDTVATAPLTTNFPPEALQHYIYSPEFKNIWELSYKTKTPAKVLGDPSTLGGANQREDAERWLGYTALTDADRPNRPHYTGVNIKRNPKGAAPTYGRFYFEWKDSVKQRATFTARDTFAMRKDADVKDIDQEELIGTADNMEATLAHNPRALIALGHEYEGDDDEAAKAHAANAFYIEAQVHGGLDARDAKALWVNYSKNNTDDMDKPYRALAEAFSQKWGVPIKHYAGG